MGQSITVEFLLEILQKLKPTDELTPNDSHNLTVTDRNGAVIAFVNVWRGKLMMRDTLHDLRNDGVEFRRRDK